MSTNSLKKSNHFRLTNAEEIIENLFPLMNGKINSLNQPFNHRRRVPTARSFKINRAELKNAI